MGIRGHASVIALPCSLHSSPPERFAFYRLERALKRTGAVGEWILGHVNRLLGRSCDLDFWRNREGIKPLLGKSAYK